jgi:hypothetical protein
MTEYCFYFAVCSIWTQTLDHGRIRRVFYHCSTAAGRFKLDIHGTIVHWFWICTTKRFLECSCVDTLKDIYHVLFVRESGMLYLCVCVSVRERVREKDGATTLSIMTLSITTLSMRIFHVTLSICDSQHKRHSALLLGWVSLCWVSHFIYYYAERHYAECRYAECRCAERRSARKTEIEGETVSVCFKKARLRIELKIVFYLFVFASIARNAFQNKTIFQSTKKVEDKT